MPGLSGELWPVHPHRLPDELLSFWMLRVAHANRIKLQTFTNVTFGQTASPWARDVDRSASPELLAKLSARTGSSIEELKAGMLSAYEGIVFEHHNSKGNSPWILPLGIYHRTRRAYGMQFCPTCLFWDPIPYYRRRWRLAFSTICDRHGALLHDRCPQCEAPVIFFRNDLGRRKNGSLGDHTSCWQCGFDLRRAAPWGADWLDAETYVALRSLLTFIDDGVGVAGPHCFDYAGLFLEVLHRVCEMLVSNGTQRRYDRLKDVVSQETGIPLPSSSGHPAFESLGLVVRHRALLCALWLLMDWPDRFVRMCGEAKLGRTYVLGDMGLAPYWFDRVLKLRLDKSTYIVSAEEARNAASYLAKQGVLVCRNSLQRILGGRHNQATVPFAVEQRSPWPQTEEAFDRLLAAADERINVLPIGGVRRLLAKRDRVIILTMKMTGWGPARVLGVTLAEIDSMLRSQRSTLPSDLREQLLCYIRSVRRALVRGQDRVALFVGWGGDGIGIANLAQMVRRLCIKR